MFAKDMNACDSAPCPETSNILLHYYAMQRSKNALNTCVFGLCTKDMTACDSRSRSRKVKQSSILFALCRAKGKNAVNASVFGVGTAAIPPPPPPAPQPPLPRDPQKSRLAPGSWCARHQLDSQLLPTTQVDQLKPGDCFGELPLLQLRPHQHSVVAKESGSRASAIYSTPDEVRNLLVDESGEFGLPAALPSPVPMQKRNHTHADHHLIVSCDDEASAAC